MKLEDIPENVRNVLVNDMGHNEDSIIELTPKEVFGLFLHWHGIIGYETMLWNAAKSLMAYEVKSSKCEHGILHIHFCRLCEGDLNKFL